MSYLDKPLTREFYFEHISTKSKSHKVNYIFYKILSISVTVTI